MTVGSRTWPGLVRNASQESAIRSLTAWDASVCLRRMPEYRRQLRSCWMSIASTARKQPPVGFD